MGGSPITLGSTLMVSSPLHITATLDLEQRLVKATPLAAPTFDDVPSVTNNNNKVNKHHGGGNVGPLLLEMEPPTLDDSHGSSSDLAIRKLLQGSSVMLIPEKKHVAFGSISTRAYNIVLGDHPCCSLGCPLALGWEYSQGPSLSVDEYEAARSPRRSRDNLKTTWDQRRNMLADVSDREVKHNERKLHRERSCQRQRNRRACAAFFGQPEDCQARAAADTHCT